MKKLVLILPMIISANFALIGIFSINLAAMTAEDLINNLAPNKSDCGAALSKNYKRKDDPATAFACLIAGNRNVIWYGLDQIKEQIDPFDPVLVQNLISKYAIKEFQRTLHFQSGEPKVEKVTYSPAGERNALLFLLQFPSNVELIHFSENPYLFGSLLGYDKNDIEFYYKKNNFLRLQAAPDKGIIIREHFLDWPASLKSSFENYEKNIWPASNGYKKYQDDIQKAQAWIKSFEKYNIEELKKLLINPQSKGISQ